MKYIVITPVYNEEKHIEGTICSMINQDLKPSKWIIVDDGSNDTTVDIVKKYLTNYNWIELVRNEKREERASGSKVVRAFYIGYDTINEHDYEFIVKLDGDLGLPPHYFKAVSDHLEKNPKVGICGGNCLIEENGQWIREEVAEYHVRGALKAYRKACFDQMGGLKPIFGWDGLDELKSLYNCWEVSVLPLDVYHYRKTGKVSNPYKLYSGSGRSHYKMGFDILTSVAKSLTILFRDKMILPAIYFELGFLKAFVSEDTKFVTQAEQRFIRKFQRDRMRIKMKSVLKRF